MDKEDYIRQLDRILTGFGRRFANVRRGFEELPVSGPEFFLLRHVKLAGPLSVSAVAEGLALDQSTISNLVNALEAKGLVQREKDPADRRVTLVNVTGAGCKVLDQAAAARFRRVRQLFSRLSEEDLAHLVRIFSKLRQWLEQIH